MKKFGLLLLLAFTAYVAKAQHEHHQHVAGDSTTVDTSKLTLLNHTKKMEELFGKPKMEIKKIGILVYDGMFLMDAIGPMTVLSELMGTEVFYIGVKKGNVKAGRTEIVIKKTIKDVKSLDILIVPGGSDKTWAIAQDTNITNWIKAIDATTQITASVCSGAWILGEAGLLKGRNASTHWYRADEMMKCYGATYTAARYTVDGKYWTSAGVTAGMDMSLAIILAIRGENYTQGAMLDLEYDPQPPISGGTPAKSNQAVVHMMQSMYDYVMRPLINKK